MILVTGGTGFIGSHLVARLLSKGHEVLILTRNNSNRDGLKKVLSHYFHDMEAAVSKIQMHEGDLSDYVAVHEAVNKADAVFHCGARVAFDTSSKSKRRQLINTNRLYSKNIVNALLEKGNTPLIHVSSVAALGNSINGECRDELTGWNSEHKRSAYARSKFESELEVWRGMEEGLSAAIVNPSVVLGIGNWEQGSMQFFDKVAKGLNYYTGGATGFVDVRDVTDIMIELYDKSLYGKRYVVNAANISYKKLLHTIAKEMNVTPPEKSLTRRWLMTLGAMGRFIAKFGFNNLYVEPEMITAAYEKSCFKNEKISKDLNFTFIPLEKTIRWIVEAYKSEKNE